MDSRLRGNDKIAFMLLFLITIAFFSLIYAHATSDFRLLNVAQNSHSAKPFIYKISGAWGNHEGSMLLFIWFISLYTAAFAGLAPESGIKKNALRIQAGIMAGFLLFSIVTSNPFALISPVPHDGNGQNPILQDIGLAIHPPVLYAGYTGFSLVLSLAMAVLLAGKIPEGFPRILKKWIIIPWCFLTLGIALGSWWAYRELGWGGFWFWDPVENSSLMPWLAATALYHSAVILQKRGMFPVWVIFLAILTFTLSLIGFFLVRSGVLTSVHSFASDPLRGVFILLLLALISGSAFLLFALKAAKFRTDGNFGIISRESGIMLNNLFLITLCLTVFLGTVYPILLEVITGELVSVGAPYYYLTFVPIALGLIFFAGIGPFLKWQKNDKSIFRNLIFPLFATIAISCVLYFILGKRFDIFYFSIVFGIWLLFTTLYKFYRETLFKNFAQPRTFYAMIISHLGVALLVIGIAASQGWKAEEERNIKIGEQVDFVGYHLTFEDVKLVPGKNYLARRGIFSVHKNGGFITDLKPEVRFFPIEGGQTTESAIYYDFLSNLYIVIGDPAGENSYAARFYYRPFIVLIWLGAFMIALGGAVSLFKNPWNLSFPRRRESITTGLEAPVTNLKASGIWIPACAGMTKRSIPFILLLLLLLAFLLKLAANQSGDIFPKTPMIGKTAPDFSLPTLSGKTVKLRDLRGKIILVNFFASWCEACGYEQPALAALAKNGAPIYGIAWEDKDEKTRKWLSKFGNPYKETLTDHDGRTGLNFGITGVPETFLLSREGVILFKIAAPIDEESYDNIVRIIGEQK